MLQSLPQTTAYAPANEKEPAGCWVGQQRRMNGLLGGQALCVEHHQAILIEDALCFVSRDRQPAIDGIAREDHAGILPAQSRQVPSVAL